MANTKPQIKIVNVETGEEIIRDATTAEIAEMQSDKATAITEKTVIAEKEAARQAIADRLGLTADELAVLLG
jgi:hypothetical protein